MNISLVNLTLKYSIWSAALIAASFTSCSCLAQTQSKITVAPVAQSSPPEKTPDTKCQPVEEFDVSKLPEWNGSELHRAVMRLDVKNVATLLRQKTDASVTDNYGDTPLISVVKPRIEEPSLLPPGVVPDAQTRERNRRRRLARDEAQIKIIELLLAHGVNVNQKDDYGRTALFDAAAFGYEPSRAQKILLLLIQHKADVNLQDKRGYSALMRATQSGNRETVKFLLARGADPALKNCDGQTALTIAESKDFTEIVRMLKNR